MRFAFRLLGAIAAIFSFAMSAAGAGAGDEKAAPKGPPKEVRVGAYLMSLYELNPTANTFSAEFWLWFVHDKKYELKPLKSLEAENARDLKTSLETTEDHGDQSYHAEKVRGVFNYGWDCRNFPFDRHELRIRLSEGQDESSVLTYAADAANTGFDPELKLVGWRIDKVTITTGTHTFDSSFGEPGESAGSNYAQAIISIFVTRQAMGLFWKLHAAVYIAFLIGMISFFMDTSKDTIFNGRVGILAGMVFAVVINTQRVAAILGQSPSFTLADKVHIATLVALLFAIIAALISRRLHVRGFGEMANRIDHRMAAALFALYFMVNGIMIALAAHGQPAVLRK